MESPYDESRPTLEPVELSPHVLRRFTSAQMLRAFRHRNFRLFTSGQIISLLGTWTQRLAVGWLAYQLTQSAFWVGVVSFAGLFPGFLIGPFAGSVADSRNRFALLKFTQIACMIQAAVLAGMTLSGAITIHGLIVLEMCLALVTALDIPVRQSFVIQMVGKEDLPNAIAINSSMVNVGRMLGPAIAGIIIAVAGIGQAFLWNAISYIAVIYCLYQMKLAPEPERTRSGSIVQHTLEGFRYAWRNRTLRIFLSLYASMCTFGMPYLSLMPVYAAQRFHHGAAGLSWLVAASGAGALVGTIYLATRTDTRGLRRRVIISGLCLGAALIALSFLQNFTLAVCVMPFAGYGMMMQMAGNNTLFQTIVDDHHRGRLMSLFTMSFLAGVPIGSLLMGILAQQFGLLPPLLLGGSVCMMAAGSMAIILRKKRRESFS